MRRELDYFRIGKAYGGSQDWFGDFMMRIGGCAALAACESCIYLALNPPAKNGSDSARDAVWARRWARLYPYARERLSREDYIRFGIEMKPYLRPRMGGVDRLELYVDGFGKYLAHKGVEELSMEPFWGTNRVEDAKERMIGQIDKGYPVPCLTLKHRDPAFKNYTWHWYLLTGYESFEERLMVKAVTYGNYRWLDFGRLWETGYRRKGGLILYRLRSA